MTPKEYKDAMIYNEAKSADLTSKMKKLQEEIEKLKSQHYEVSENIRQINKKAAEQGLLTVKVSDLLDEICALSNCKLSDLNVVMYTSVKVWGRSVDMDYVRKYTKEKSVDAHRTDLCYCIKQGATFPNSKSIVILSVQCPLDLEKEMSDGTKLYQHIYLESKYTEEGYCSQIRFKPEAIEKSIITINPRDFATAHDASLIRKAICNIAEKRESTKNTSFEK